MPGRDWIDDATAQNPVLISRADGHMAPATRLALSLAGIGGGDPDTPGGEIARAPTSRLESRARRHHLGEEGHATPRPCDRKRRPSWRRPRLPYRTVSRRWAGARGTPIFSLPKRSAGPDLEDVLPEWRTWSLGSPREGLRVLLDLWG